MGNTGRALTDLGKAISASQDEGLRRVDLAPGRDRLLRAAARAPAPSTWRRAAMLAFAATLLVAAAMSITALRPSPLRFEVGRDPGRADAWIAAPSGGPLPLHFSDGTIVSLGPDARARVTDVDRRGARVVLERGALTASVVHRSDTRWRVDVGPFEVRVTGTSFDVAWSPDDETFRLTLREGRVEVTGPVLGDRRAVAAGETVIVSCRDRRLVLSAGDLPEPSITASIAAPLVAPPAISASASAATATAPPRSTYRELARSGRYADAVRAAEEEGFAGVCERASAADLMELADAARFAGSAGRAGEALTALRRRFPGHALASTAAFVLGRMAFERGAYADAARWFSTYLREQPSGPLAREALGRLMECRERSGDVEGAREAAERYLAAHPGGAHAERARRLLER